ncbi:MAG TPA: AAA family ATPase, partial [Ktedonobacteraceae bacterium]|nr:AAA family ATPase [Ktedonobacteraceae bacterium]
LDLGPSTIAIVPQAGGARLDVLCAELQPATQAIRRLQRKMDRQRRAANPDNKERRLRAHRRSLHGRLVHEIVRMGNTIVVEKISYQGWQKQFGTSVGLRAPGMLIAQLRRTVASTGGTLWEVSTRTTRLSQFCHGCGKFVKKPLSQRWHHCPCGVGPVQHACPKVRASRNKSQSPSFDEGDWKRGACARNPRRLSTGAFRSVPVGHGSF